MGLNLRKIIGGVRDIFDANTEADKQRRAAMGQPREYKQQSTAQMAGNIAADLSSAAVKASPLALMSRYNNAALGLVNKNLGRKLQSGQSDAEAGVGRYFANVPTTAISVGTAASELGAKYNPVARASFNTFNKGKNLDQEVKKQVDAGMGFARDMNATYDKGKQVNARDNLTYKIANAVPSVVESAGLYAVNPALGMAVGGARTYGNTAQESYNKTGRINQGAALGDAAVTAALEKVQPSNILKLANGVGGKQVEKEVVKQGGKVVFKVLKDLAKGAGAEGAQEGIQQLSSNLIAKASYDPNRDPMQGVVESAGIGALLGSGTNVVAGGASGQYRKPKVTKKSTQTDAIYNNYDQPKNGPNSQFSPRTASQLQADAAASEARAKSNKVQARRTVMNTPNDGLAHVTTPGSALGILDDGKIRANPIGEQGGAKGVSMGTNYTGRNGETLNWADQFAEPGQPKVKINIDRTKLNAKQLLQNDMELTHTGDVPLSAIKSIETDNPKVAAEYRAKGVPVIDTNAKQPRATLQTAPKSNSIVEGQVAFPKRKNSSGDWGKVIKVEADGTVHLAMLGDNNRTNIFNPNQIDLPKRVSDPRGTGKILDNTPEGVGSKATKPKAYYQNVPKSYTEPKVTAKGASKVEATKPTRRVADTLDEQLAMVGTDTSTDVGKRMMTPLYKAWNSVYGKNVDKARTAVNESITNAQQGSGIVARVANAPRQVWARFGMTDSTRALLDKAQAIKTAAGEVSTHLKEKIGQTLQEGDSLERVKQHLQQEDFVKAKYGQDARRLSFEELTPNEQKVVTMLKEVRKQHNDLNYQGGRITAEQYAAGKDGSHAARVYDFGEPKGNGQGGKVFDTNLSRKRTDANELNDYTIDKNYDEITSTAIRNEVVLRNAANQEVLDGLAKDGLITKEAGGNKVELDGRFGEYEGMFADRQVVKELTNKEIFSSGTAQAYRGLLDKYQETVLGKVDRVQKATKTTLNVGTSVGNVVSNIVAFARGSGINPLTHTKNMAQATARLTKVAGGEFDPGVYAAQKAGLDIGSSKTGFELNGIDTEQLATTTAQKKDIMSRTGRAYGRMDDAHKLAMFEELQRRGMTAEEAAQRTNLFSQDYNNVGRTINLFADSPLLGRPFARFAVELTRMGKNIALYNPIGVAAGLGGLALLTKALSDAAGEDDEERKARETQVGQTLLPGTAWINKLATGTDRNISMNLAIGDAAVNISRITGLNFPIEPGADPNRAILEQLLPFEIPTRKDALGNEVVDPTKLITSLTLRPFVEQALNQNFMGNKVSDPTNRTYDSEGNVKKYTPLSEGEQLVNRGRALFSSLAPMGNELDSVVASAMGKPTTTGKERTVTQSLLRVGGIKAEKNDKKSREDRVGTSEYFDTTKAAEDKFLNENKDLQSLYFSVFPKTKDRTTGKKVSDQITPEKWTKVKSDTSGRLYDFMRQQAIESNKKDSKYPVDPIFKLPTREQQKQLLELRSKPTGEDIEMDNILEAKQSWYRDFKKAEQKYYEDSESYYKGKGLPDTQNQRAKDYGNIKWPEQPKGIQAYYNLKEKDPTAAKNLFKTTNLSDEFDAYKQEKLKYYNAKRKIEGYPPISADTFNNVTFGYEDDEQKVFNELKYGKGYGGYSKSGSDNPDKYTVSSKAPMSKAVSFKAPSALKKVTIKSAKLTKAKVGSRRSLV